VTHSEENYLKAIYHLHQYGTKAISTNAIAEQMETKPSSVTDMIKKLSDKDLVHYKKYQGVSLTEKGKHVALAVIRKHRLWELFLVEKLNFSWDEVHEVAEQLEHIKSEKLIDQLDELLEYPQYDPHGDPIPTVDGELPQARGISLNSMQEGEMGRITHLEDEPKSIYEQLVVLGLYPGMQVYVTDVTDQKITFVADGDECILTPLFAGYITVEKASAEVIQSPKHELLSSLTVGEQARVLGISPNCRGQQRRRLMDLGIVPGSQISVVMKSASGDPMGYRVMGTTIGIRKQQADYVFINREN